jgi:hypothetical protein
MFCGLVNCSSVGKFSDMIKKMTNSKWSHTALIVTGMYDEDKKKFKDNGNINYVVEFSKEVNGIRVTKLNKYLVYYKAYMEVAILENFNVSDDDKQKVYDYINNIIEQNIPYEQYTKDFKYALSGPHLANDKNDSTSFFCSEFVAEVYKLLGLLPKEISSNSYLPSHFGGDGDIKKFKNNISKILPKLLLSKNSILIHPYKLKIINKILL